MGHNSDIEREDDRMDSKILGQLVYRALGGGANSPDGQGKGKSSSSKGRGGEGGSFSAASAGKKRRAPVVDDDDLDISGDEDDRGISSPEPARKAGRGRASPGGGKGGGAGSYKRSKGAAKINTDDDLALDEFDAEGSNLSVGRKLHNEVVKALEKDSQHKKKLISECRAAIKKILEKEKAWAAKAIQACIEEDERVWEMGKEMEKLQSTADKLTKAQKKADASTQQDLEKIRERAERVAEHEKEKLRDIERRYNSDLDALNNKAKEKRRELAKAEAEVERKLREKKKIGQQLMDKVAQHFPPSGPRG